MENLLENDVELMTIISHTITFSNTIEEDIKKRLLIIAEESPRF